VRLAVAVWNKFINFRVSHHLNFIYENNALLNLILFAGHFFRPGAGKKKKENGQGLQKGSSLIYRF